MSFGATITIDGVPVELAYPTLAPLVRRLGDSLRKHYTDPDDWPTRAKQVIDSYSDDDFRHLIGDLMRLRDEYPEAGEQGRLLADMGWTTARDRQTDDAPLTMLAVIEQLVYQAAGSRTGSALTLAPLASLR